MIQKTLHLKVKREAYPYLEQAAREVNTVWNYANETSAKAIRRYCGKARFLSGFDLCKLTAGATAYFEHIGADTIAAVVQEYALRRKQHKKAVLKFRASSGARKALGWIPVKADVIKVRPGGVSVMKKKFRLFEADLLRGALKVRAGDFSQNAVGEWFFNVAVDLPLQQPAASDEVVGIDLGLRSIATTSDGEQLSSASFFRDIEQKLASAQRRGHKRQAKRLHAKAANRRKDALHKFTSRIVARYQNIRIGNVSPAAMAKTRFGKSSLDSGWGMLTAQLQYKGHWAGRSVEVVDEAYTTRACSNCGQLSGPGGLRQLAIRQWSCECGATHDRDVNAAKNIARLRYQPPLAGTRGRGRKAKGDAMSIGLRPAAESLRRSSAGAGGE